MSNNRPGGRLADSEPIPFGRHLACSELFHELFRAGMTLVEETATYLDGDGRNDSRQLGRVAALAYTTEAMRLTTRLMQLASWLLLQRAVNDGDAGSDESLSGKSRVRIADLATATEGPGWDALPDRLRGLIRRSLRLQERIRHLDGALVTGAPIVPDNPVARHIGRIEREFGR